MTMKKTIFVAIALSLSINTVVCAVRDRMEADAAEKRQAVSFERYLAVMANLQKAENDINQAVQDIKFWGIVESE